jgi:hypothetical protein
MRVFQTPLFNSCTSQSARYSETLQANIRKKANPSLTIFLRIEWEAFSTSFKRLTHSHQIHTAKLVHQLANTNRQNNIFLWIIYFMPLLPSRVRGSFPCLQMLMYHCNQCQV